MIILVPEKSFKKKIEKWVKHKDFVIADALERHDGTMREYGNRIDADEFNATPTLTKIAMDPSDKESQIKKRHLNKYIGRWLDDEGINIKLLHLVGCIVQNWINTGEDLNVFIVMRDPIFYAYHEAVESKINDDYGVEVATSVTHKMDKAKVKEILRAEKDKDYFKTLKKNAKRIRKTLDVRPEETMTLGDMDDYD